MAQNTCVVILMDGAPCGRTVAYASNTRCPACRQWSRYHGGANPAGRARRARRQNGELVAELQRAARATADECVILTGYSHRPAVDWNGRPMAASRAVWIIANGDPGEAWVLHTCHRGEEGCISIRHLYLGDVAQNNRDIDEAGRRQLGVDRPQAKLDEDRVREIRRLFAAGGVTKSALARQFGISRGTLRNILDGTRWKHVTS